MDKTANDYVALYKEQLEKGDIQKAYVLLMKYILSLKSHFAKKVTNYSYGNLSAGYMDYTYFPFYNQFLRNKELRFGIVFNHTKVRLKL